jgi:hypothetical protein
MKKAHLLSLVTAGLLAASVFTGCGTAYDTTYYEPSVHIEPAHNFLGIVKVAPHSYQPVDPTTISLRTSEVFATRNISGNNVELFWGAITITGY